MSNIDVKECGVKNCNCIVTNKYNAICDKCMINRTFKGIYSIMEDWLCQNTEGHSKPYADSHMQLASSLKNGISFIQEQLHQKQKLIHVMAEALAYNSFDSDTKPEDINGKISFMVEVNDKLKQENTTMREALDKCLFALKRCIGYFKANIELKDLDTVKCNSEHIIKCAEDYIEHCQQALNKVKGE